MAETVEISFDEFKTHQAENDDAANVALDVDDDHPIADANGQLAHYQEVEENHSHHHRSDSKVFPIADINGNLTHPEEYQNYHHHLKEDSNDDSNDNAKASKKSRSTISAGIESFKYLYSLALLVFAVIVVMAAIFTEQTTAATRGIHPVGAFFIFWILLSWLAMMEGGQGALVGLQPIDKALYAVSHPRALKNTKLAHKGDNMKRVIVGRQFLTVVVIFLTNMMASAIPDASVFGFPTIVNDIFLASGVSVILITIMIGQLTAQVNAANCMLDFINNYYMLFTIYVSLLIEFCGLLHSVYLVQIFFSKITGTPIDSNESPRNAKQKAFFWARVLTSLAILGICFAVTVAALFQGKTAMWDSVPVGASVALFFILMCVVGLMEGMQIALFAVVNMNDDELQEHKIAYANCELAFSGHNLQAFLIGRQICVTICMFVVARITSINVAEGEGNIFGVSDGLQAFFNTGLLGAVITTVCASLAWRIIASSFPLAYLSNPLVYVIIRLCLVLEASGICSAAWVLAVVHKKVAKYKVDEEYIGTPEECAASSMNAEDADELALEAQEAYPAKTVDTTA